MKILLLGSNGQLGSDIQLIHKQYYPKDQLIPINRQHCDFSKIGMIQPFLSHLEFDILINCISYNKTNECESNPDLAFIMNAFCVKEMAMACQIKNAKLIHYSTDYVFGHHASNTPLDESVSPAPLSVYGASKWKGENLALAHHDEVFILRTASLFGTATSSSKKGNFVESIYEAAQKNESIKVINDIYMSPTGSFDLAKMTFKLIEANAPAGIYHAVNSGQASWFEFAESILQQTQSKAKIAPISASEYRSQMQRPSYSVLDNAKIQNTIGEIPNWQEALHRYLKEKNYC